MVLFIDKNVFLVFNLYLLCISSYNEEKIEDSTKINIQTEKTQMVFFFGGFRS